MDCFQYNVAQKFGDLIISILNLSDGCANQLHAQITDSTTGGSAAKMEAKSH